MIVFICTVVLFSKLCSSYGQSSINGSRHVKENHPITKPTKLESSTVGIFYRSLSTHTRDGNTFENIRNSSIHYNGNASVYTGYNVSRLNNSDFSKDSQKTITHNPLSVSTDAGIYHSSSFVPSIPTPTPTTHQNEAWLPAADFRAANVTYISLNVTWHRPYGRGTGDIKDYTLHFFLAKDRDDESLHHRILLGANESCYILSNLRSGTRYSAYLITRFNGEISRMTTTHAIFITTKGYGPDRACPCDPLGVVDKTSCDAVSGKCNCRSIYYGDRCERCITGYYRFYQQKCKRCPCALNISNGICTVHNIGRNKKQVVECHCVGQRIGPLCQFCNNGFYGNMTTECRKCECNGNVKRNSVDICDSETGRCKNCQYNTTGFLCEKCKEGYEGDPIFAKNCTISFLILDGSLAIKENKNVIMGVTATFGSILLVIMFIFACKKYHNWRRWQPQPFWTVELKDDHETVSFSSMAEQDYQNVDAALLIDDINYYDRGLTGQLRVGSPEPISYHSINA